MLQHNLTIALRNLWKYKLQTAISIASIAIGIVTLALVHGLMQRHLRPASITTMPYYDRVCVLRFDSLLTQSYAGVPVWIDGNIMRAMTDGGGLRCTEMGPIMSCQTRRSRPVTYTLGDTLVRKCETLLASLSASYPHFAGHRSALTDERIAVLRCSECIIAESLAKRVFGDANPVGAHVQFHMDSATTLSLTIADVYQDAAETDDFLNGLLFATTEAADYDVWYHQAFNSYVLLKSETTLRQLEAELYERLEPLGLKAHVVSLKDREGERTSLLARAHFFAYLFGSLILLAAGIGFLRMQTQLLWMRKREISLRIVHGAKRGQLFALLMTEVGLVVLCAVAVALVFGRWLEHFLTTTYDIMLNNSSFVVVSDLVQYSAAIGLAALALCAIIVWLTLHRICNNAYGLAAAMRGSRSHTFRNVMLWVQVSVGMLFMCATFVITVMAERHVDMWVIPDDDTRYRESILMDMQLAENKEQLLDELSRLPDAAQRIPYRELISSFDEITGDSLKQQFRRRNLTFMLVEIQDTALLDFYRVRVSWLKPSLKAGPCILVNEALYPALERSGVLAHGALTTYYIGYRLSLPVAGTFQTMPFENTDEDCHDFILIHPDIRATAYIIESKAGRYDALWRDVRSTIARVEPTVVAPMAYNLYEMQASGVELIKNLRKGAWLLGAVALLVCVMGIYSTIALDTRARRKEMAIRKINGAKSWDIARIFVRLYVVLLASAIVPIIPLAVWFQRTFNVASMVNDPRVSFPVALPVAAGCLTVILTVALIVGWHVRNIMRVNPADIIAKE